MYQLLVVKRKLESMIMFPFILLGWLIARLQGNKEEYDIYFFFPFHHVGGAEKVHYLIAQAFFHRKCIIYFTRQSKGSSLLGEFEKAGFIIRDISRFTDNKFLYPLNFLFRGIISGKINLQSTQPTVFNGQSNFGYKLSPWISKKVPQVDLIHALCSFSYIRIPFLGFYRHSVTVSKEIVFKHNELYEKYNVPATIRDKLRYIDYGIELPAKLPKTNFRNRVGVLYVGRGSAEKRVHIIAKIAEECHRCGTEFDFGFVGDVKEFIPPSLWKFCRFYGSVTSEVELDRVYREHNILMVTSNTESGPLVVMEAMARGLAIAATPVGIVNEHVSSGRNGFVFSSLNEDVICQEAVSFLNQFSSDKKMQAEIASNNQAYAFETFGIERFKQDYRDFLDKINLRS
jgi:glycosyltransferase involved in cell wall biosynthesis